MSEWQPLSAFFADEQDGPLVCLKVGDRGTLGYYDDDESCWRDASIIGEEDDGRPWEFVERESRISLTRGVRSPRHSRTIGSGGH
jgi:hypothetical protein